MKMNGFLSIIRKEFARFFRDKRMVLTTLVMPGLLIYLLYSLMGSGMSSFFQDEEEMGAIYVKAMPASMESMIEEVGFSLVSYEDTEAARKALDAGELALVAVFADDFDAQLDKLIAGENVTVPTPTLYYYSTDTLSYQTYLSFVALLDGLEAALNPPLFHIEETSYDLSSEEDMGAQIYAMILPMLLMMMLFSGCLAVAPEAIAGEKERGTIATLLVTPLNRTHLALGKILSLSVIALLSGISSTVGILLSLPKLMGGAMEGMSLSMYQVTDALALVAVILPSVLVIVSLVALISAYARSVKEASAYVSPFMIVVALIGVSSMFTMGDLPTAAYMVPLFNSVTCISGIFLKTYGMTDILVTAVTNIAIAGLFTYALTRMFNNEKMMFNK